MECHFNALAICAAGIRITFDLLHPKKKLQATRYLKAYILYGFIIIEL